MNPHFRTEVRAPILLIEFLNGFLVSLVRTATSYPGCPLTRVLERTASQLGANDKLSDGQLKGMSQNCRVLCWLIRYAVGVSGSGGVKQRQRPYTSPTTATDCTLTPRGSYATLLQRLT